MPLPNVTISKVAANVGSARPSNLGVLAIVASSQQGTANVPAGYSRTDLALNDFGYGPLVESGAYLIDVAGNPIVLCKPTTAQAASYGTITHSGVLGTSVPTAGGTAPLEHYGVIVNVIAGGTIGVAGITYVYSLDGGQHFSGVQALGTSSTLTIPNSGVSFTLSSGTLLAGDTWNVFTERAMPTDTDLPASFTALQNTKLPWEGVYFDSVFTSSTIGLADAWLLGLEAMGMFRFGLFNTRFKTEPVPTGETESAYATAMATLVSSSTSIRCCVGADGGRIASPITGFSLKRPTALPLGARAMATPIGEDAAFVAEGPLTDVEIADTKGNPFDHDEFLFPNLDALRLVTLRTFASGNPEGVYIGNPNTIEASGGDFVYLQHIRVMNRACETAWAALAKQLSRGVRKNPKKDPVTGAVTIFEPDAAAIESFVNSKMQAAVKGQVTAAQFSLSRTDDLSVVPTTVHGLISIVALAYIKGFAVTAEFSKVIQIAA